jgi:hypothetical protein
MFSYYDLTVPVFTKSLKGLHAVLTKAKEHGLPQDFLTSTLASDMFPFVRQVQVACDNAKGAVQRLAQVEAPSFPDTEATWDELLTRITATITFIESVSEGQFTQASDVTISLPYFPGMYMTAPEYLVQYVLPNFFFHVTTAYALVRQAGVPIGKADYMNGWPLRPLAA